MNENPYSTSPAEPPAEPPVERPEQSPAQNAASSTPLAASATMPPSWPVQFDGRFSETWSVVIPLLFGGLAILVGLMMFAAHLLFLDATNQLTLHLTSTFPIIAGVFSVIRGVAGRQAARHVRLWPQGIEIQSAQTETIPWDSITGVRVVDSSSPGTPNEKVMVFSGADGEPISRITGKLAKNEGLLQCIQKLIKVSDSPETAKRLPPTSNSSRKKGRRMAVLTGFGGILLALAGIFLPLNAYWEYQASQTMASQGVAAEGVVTEKFVAPNGRTLRLRYEVTDESGEVAEHNVEVTDSLFDEVAEGGSIPITTVPGSPGISELQRGQVITNDPIDNPIVTGALGLFGIVAACFMLPMTVLMWKGYDVNFNKGKFQIVPMS